MDSITKQKLFDRLDKWQQIRNEIDKELIKSADGILATISKIQNRYSPRDNEDCVADDSTPCDCPRCQAYETQMKAEYEAGKLDPPKVDEDEEGCIHWEHEHGICMECGEDIFDSLVGAAEAHFEGDR